jgi:hypothetical protein
MDRFILRKTDGKGFEWLWAHSEVPGERYAWLRTFDGADPVQMSWGTALDRWNASPGTELVDTGDNSMVDYYVPEWDPDMRVEYSRDGREDRIRKALRDVSGVEETSKYFRIPEMQLEALKSLLLRVGVMLCRKYKVSYYGNSRLWNQVFRAHLPEDFVGDPWEILEQYTERDITDE